MPETITPASTTPYATTPYATTPYATTPYATTPYVTTLGSTNTNNNITTPGSTNNNNNNNITTPGTTNTNTSSKYPTYGGLADVPLPYVQIVQNLKNIYSENNDYVAEISAVIQTNSIPNAPTTKYRQNIVDAVLKIPYLKKNILETTVDVANDDIQQLLFQQNTMYITGTLSCATLLIYAIYFARE